MSIAEKLTTIAENQQKVYEAGQKSEYDRFWDAYQTGTYQNQFSGKMWKNSTFKPKYDIKPTSTGYMLFYYSGIKGDLVSILDELGVTLDTSECKSFQYTFGYSEFTRIGVIDMRNATNLNTAMLSTFQGAKVETIDKLIFRDDGTQTFSNNAFQNCANLINLTIEGTIGQNGFNVQWSPLLSRESIDSILDHLKDFTEWTLNNSVSYIEQDSTTGEFPHDKVKIILNENIENPQNYFLVYQEGNRGGSQLSPELTTGFNENGELIIDGFFMTYENDGRTEFIRVEDGNGNTLVKGTDYNIYTGILPSTSKTVTFNATAVDNAYTNSDEWQIKVSQANKNGWTVETV